MAYSPPRAPRRSGSGLLLIKIAPSVLAADFAKLGEQVQEAEAGGADLLHVDIMDGHFVPPVNLGILAVEAINRATSLFLDVHLMVERPDHLLSAFIEAGADSLTVHYEATAHIHRLINDIRKSGARAGSGINPGTSATVLADILPDIDMALVMTVNPGWGGQPFISSCLEKVRWLRQRRQDLRLAFDIEVDGGVTPDNIAACTASGANVIVAGTSVFRASEGIAAAITALRRAAGEASGK
jgi:ribulose-phosphate 3-epimerase